MKRTMGSGKLYLCPTVLFFYNYFLGGENYEYYIGS